MNKLIVVIVGFLFSSIVNGAHFFNDQILFNVFQHYPECLNLMQLDATNRVRDLDSSIGYWTDLEEIYSKALEGSNIRCVFLGERNYLLYPKAFMNAYELRWLDIGGVEEISKQCFENCLNLKIVMGKRVKTIKLDAFWNCHEIELLYFPNLQNVDPNAFRGSSVRFLVLPGALIPYLLTTGITLIPAEQCGYLDALCLTDV